MPRSAVLSNIIGEEKNKHLKTKQNKTIQKEQTVFAQIIPIVASVSVSCESLKSKHEDSFGVNTTRVFVNHLGHGESPFGRTQN